MKMRRNQPSGLGDASSCPSCMYDEIFATAQALAAGASTTTPLGPQYSRYFCPQFIDTVVMSAADSNINGRAVVTDVTIQSCSQFDASGTASAASAGVVIPDGWSSSAECCLGTPICWGAFGQAGVNENAVISETNLDPAAALDIYFVVRGRARNELNGSWRLGNRCTR